MRFTLVTVALLLGMIAVVPTASAGHRGIIQCPGQDPAESACVAVHNVFWFAVGLGEDVEDLAEEVIGFVLGVVGDAEAVLNCMLFEQPPANWGQCF